MIFPPHTLSGPDRYCRLLRPFQHSGDPADVKCRLARLARSMYPEVPPTLVEAAAVDGERLAAPAYTYFGQFILHDLTFDDTPFRSAGSQEPEHIKNDRTPRLDLDSVYGDGPGSARHGHLYDGVCFHLGTTVLSPMTDGPFDVPLDQGNKPAVVDERNCENIILRQIHAMFLMLHNVAVDCLDETVTDQDDLFEAARDAVRWQFQWLVRHDFLPKICDSLVYEAVFANADRQIIWPPGQFSIPVEFSQAAARFGHSMVRGEYQLVAGKPEVGLDALFGSIQRRGALPANMAIQWSIFATDAAQAEIINTLLVDPLRRLPDDVIDPFVDAPMPHEPHMLAIRTLQRGSATKLPTGQQMCAALQPAAPIPVSNTSAAWQSLKAFGFENETPLWFYILLEAEIQGRGHRLGTVGSRIVAEVIEAALLHDGNSLLAQPGWTPEAPRPFGWKKEIREFLDVAIVVGLEP